MSSRYKEPDECPLCGNEHKGKSCGETASEPITPEGNNGWIDDEADKWIEENRPIFKDASGKIVSEEATFEWENGAREMYSFIKSKLPAPPKNNLK